MRTKRQREDERKNSPGLPLDGIDGVVSWFKALDRADREGVLALLGNYHDGIASIVRDASPVLKFHASDTDPDVVEAHRLLNDPVIGGTLARLIVSTLSPKGQERGASA